MMIGNFPQATQVLIRGGGGTVSVVLPDRGIIRGYNSSLNGIIGIQSTLSPEKEREREGLEYERACVII